MLHAFAYVFEGSGTFSSASQPFGILTEVAHAAAATSWHVLHLKAEGHSPSNGIEPL
jgi:hypothetical protein